MISRGIRVQFLCFRMKQLECSREWSPHSPQIVGTERSAKILSGLSGTCHGICYSNTQGKVTARERQQEHLSNQEKNRLAQDHRAWNTGEIKLEKENILVLPQFPDMQRKPQKNKCRGQFWPWTLRSWEIKQIPTGTAETGMGQAPLSTTWRDFWAVTG